MRAARCANIIVIIGLATNAPSLTDTPELPSGSSHLRQFKPDGSL